MWERRYYEEFDFDDEKNIHIWNAIVALMDDEIRERVHGMVAPCSKRYFIENYIGEDPEFEQVLAEEFSIEWC